MQRAWRESHSLCRNKLIMDVLRIRGEWLRGLSRKACLSCRGSYHYFNVPPHPSGNGTRVHAGVWHIFQRITASARRDPASTEALEPSAQTFSRLALTQLRLFAATHNSSPLRTHQSLRLQRRCWMKTAWKEESPSRGLVGMETTVFVRGGFSCVLRRFPTVLWSEKAWADFRNSPGLGFHCDFIQYFVVVHPHSFSDMTPRSVRCLFWISAPSNSREFTQNIEETPIEIKLSIRKSPALGGRLKGSWGWGCGTMSALSLVLTVFHWKRLWACGKCAISGCQVMLPNRKIVHDTFPLRAFKAKYFGSAKVNNRPDVSLDGLVVTGFSI